MKKVSKKINKAVSLSKINFFGFSSSQYWLGYFEKKSRYDRRLIPRASKLVEEFFGKELEGFILITALGFWESGKKYSQGYKYDKIYKMMKKKGLLIDARKDKSFIDMNWLRTDMYSKYITISLDNDFYIPICETIMIYDLIIGLKCFLINPELKIALYPHDDIGYGVIALSEDKSLGLKFLEFCKKDEDFNVFIDGINTFQRI